MARELHLAQEGAVSNGRGFFPPRRTGQTPWVQDGSKPSDFIGLLTERIQRHPILESTKMPDTPVRILGDPEDSMGAEEF